MSAALEELELFHEFASRRLAKGGESVSLDELLMEWHDSRDRESINAAIRRGLADVDAGRYEPAEQALQKIGREFGLSE